jgi:hypothetical protein
MMKSVRIVLLVACVALSSLLCEAQASDYQSGKIIAVEKLAATPTANSGTDAPLSAETDRYDLTIQIGDTLYTCRAKTPAESHLDWVKGKDKVSGKSMSVKRANGKTTKLAIIETKKAN